MTPSILRLQALAVVGIAFVAAACGSEVAPPSDCADQFKCDIPDGPDEEMCALRRTDAFNENQIAFQENFLRWSCADVDGVTHEDRGQEYCEYFAMVQLPPAGKGDPLEEPVTLGRNLGGDYTFGTTEERLDLSYNQLTELEADESAIVGQCIFTSWNSDIPGPVAACAEGSTSCPEILGVPVHEDIFQMRFDVNSADAAQILVEDCVAGVGTSDGDPENAKDPLNDDFYRGCMLNGEINETAFRKSDTTVCSASVRLAECGCEPVDPETYLPEYISPWSRLGFPLGTWSSADALPAGCRFIDEGEGSQTLVSCDLTASDVIMGAFDLKGYCSQKYADNVVVHVPLPPKEAIRCAPESSNSPYAATCGDTPWVLQDSY